MYVVARTAAVDRLPLSFLVLNSVTILAAPRGGRAYPTTAMSRET